MIFQLGSALLDACVLSVLDRGDTYGYVLTQSVKEVVDISESTLYPVLRRLQKDALLTTYDQPISGRLRRYYAITGEGRKALESYRAEWADYKEKVERLLIGGGSDAKREN
ncbi:MAG: PadR family transcriptional regulator [Clostridiaceae bacterium]|nr:PadR family transcriptional regulator [Eubacteriales bacterium]